MPHGALDKAWNGWGRPRSRTDRAGADAAAAGAARGRAGDRTDEVAQLMAAMGSGRISAGAQPVVEQALSNAAAGIAVGMGRLQEVLGMLPPQAQAPVQQAMDRLAGILQGLAAGAGAAPGAPPTGGPVSGLPVPSLPIPTGSLPVPSLPVPLADLPIPGAIGSFLEGLFGPRS